jgi:hypothetical protein
LRHSTRNMTREEFEIEKATIDHTASCCTERRRWSQIWAVNNVDKSLARMIASWRAEEMRMPWPLKKRSNCQLTALRFNEPL